MIDQPDLDPQFVTELYSASVAEDAPQVCQGLGEGAWVETERQRKGLATDHASLQGTSVLKVEAVDRDKGINDRVDYNISSENEGGPRLGLGQGKGLGPCHSRWKQLLLPLARLHEARLV